MKTKTLALLFSFATISIAAHATTGPSDTKKNDDTKKTTCMKELKKGKGVKANMEASIKCQERAIGRLAMSGVLDGDNLKGVLDKQKEFDEAYTKTMEDKKISAEEKKELQALKKEATSAVFESAWNEEAMAIRLEKLKKRMSAGEAKEQLTASEMQVLSAELEKLEAQFAKLKAGGLSTEEKKALREKFRELSKQVFDDRRDDEGQVAPTADRDKDKIDEFRRNLAASVVSCFSDGKNGNNYWEQFTDLQTVRKKESEYLKDGVLSKEERADLNQLYSKAKLDISGTCGEKKAIRSDDSGMKPGNTDQKPVDDSGMKPSNGSKDDKSKQVDTAK